MDLTREIPGVLYLYIHSAIYKKYEHLGHLKRVPIKEIKMFLSKWKIPRKIKPLVLREMELMGLIKKENVFMVEILDVKFDLENCNNYYEILNIFN